jgi:acetate kinase
MTNGLLVTFNAGSSTVKIGLFEEAAAGTKRLAKAVIDFSGAPLHFRVSEGPQVFEVDLKASASEDLTEVIAETFGWLARHFDISATNAVGHRVVHGGDRFNGPVLIDESVVAEIDGLTRLAPLHQPQALRLIRAVRARRPELNQVASFDTAFHHGHADSVQRFAIPRALHDQGIRRYGFHGLSYKFIAEELGRRAPRLAKGKVIAAHLGSGASLCGMENGISRDSSMGFSALDGIPMATRCGALDPGVLLYLFGTEGRNAKEVEDLLYRQSGLLGVSGISADSRELLASDLPEARQALDLFTFRIAGELSRIAATLGGLDGIIFTAGIGENQPWIRAEVCRRLMWLGIDLDPSANAKNAAVISSPASRISVLVIPTDEEQVIAQETQQALKG